DCPIAHNLLGEAYEKNQQLRWARAHYLAALEKNRSSQVERSEHYQENLHRVLAQLQARSKEPKKGRKGRAAHVLEVLDLRPGYVAADIGCGNGWLSEAVAKSVGPQGKVFAVDIRESSISKVLERELPNVEPVLSVEDSVTLPVDSLDVAFLHDVAAHVEKKARSRFYASIGRALKPAGRLIIFDPHGDAKEHLQELERYGFLPEQREELSGLSWDELDVQLKAGIRFRYQAVQRF
ncbi:MAG: methyltransferase domain-containing protein, partial [Planctomycetota bacterium]